MNLTLENSGSLLIAYLAGEIDHHSAAELRSQIDAGIQDKQPTHLILDFKNVTFMDSSGIGLVMGRYRLMLWYRVTGCCSADTAGYLVRRLDLLTGEYFPYCAAAAG